MNRLPLVELNHVSIHRRQLNTVNVINNYSPNIQLTNRLLQPIYLHPSVVSIYHENFTEKFKRKNTNMLKNYILTNIRIIIISNNLKDFFLIINHFG